MNVLNIETNLGWLTGKTEPMENSKNWINGKFASRPVFRVKCRKVTIHKCPRINVLNVETKPRMGDGEKWTNGKFRRLNQWKICIMAIMKKIEKWPPFRKYWSFGSPVYPTSHVCVVLHFLIFVIALVQWVLQSKFKDFLELSTKRSLHSTLWNNYTTRTSNSNELFFRNCTYIWDKYIWIFLRTHLMHRIWWHIDRAGHFLWKCFTSEWVTDLWTVTSNRRANWSHVLLFWVSLLRFTIMDL